MSREKWDILHQEIYNGKTEIEAIWKLEEGDYNYVKFNLKKIEYDKPLRY